MNTTGPGIFENDVAQQVRTEFNAAVAGGMSVYAAADRILSKPIDFLKDSDRDQIYLALAALQLDHGVIQQKIKKNALTIIIMGDELERWESAGADAHAKRAAVLQDLRTRLGETQ